MLSFGSRLNAFVGALGLGDDLASMDEKQAAEHLRPRLQRARRLAWLLIACAIVIFLLLLSLAAAGVKTWWIYSGLFLYLGAAGCLLSLLGFPLLLAFQDLSDRLPELRRSFERHIRFTASVGCLAAIAASLCFVVPIHRSPGLILLAVYALPVTAVAAFLGWSILPTWIMQKLALLPLALFVLAVAAVQFPVTAKYIGWIAEHTDRYLVRYVRETLPEETLPTRVEVPADCNIVFFDVATREPIVWYYRTPDGNYELWNNPGGDPQTSVEFALANTEEERTSILEWCRRTQLSILAGTGTNPVRPRFDVCITVRQIEDGQEVGGNSASLVLENLVRKSNLSVGAGTAGSTPEESCPVGLAEYRLEATVTATRLGAAKLSTGALFRWRMHLDASIREIASGRSIVVLSKETKEVHKEVADALSAKAFADAAREHGPALIADFAEALTNSP